MTATDEQFHGWLRHNAGRRPAYETPPADDNEARWRQLNERANAEGWAHADFGRVHELHQTTPEFAEWDTGRQNYDPNLPPPSSVRNPDFGPRSPVLPPPNPEHGFRQMLEEARWGW